MMEEIKDEVKQELVKAQPEILPTPTYVPFLLALSLLFIGWGLLSTWIITVTGVLGFGYSIYEWVKELLHERTNES
jgi:hypothetical protein